MNVINFQDANCAHCYKCLRNCDVKAIRIKQGQAQIVTDMCIYCGHCMEICPQEAKTFDSDLAYVKSLLYKKERVVVSRIHLTVGFWITKTPVRSWMHC